jgi:hypothetical protein
VGLVSLNLFPKATTGHDFQLRTSKKAYHREFGQLDFIP